MKPLKQSTSDGIPLLFWQNVHVLAANYVDCVFAEDAVSKQKTKRKLLRLLNDLEKKFGALPSILATKADYVSYARYRERLLLAAYESARRLHDVKNVTLIASSLAEMYVEDTGDVKKGELWLDKLEQALQNFPEDSEKRVYVRLKKKLLSME